MFREHGPVRLEVSDINAGIRNEREMLCPCRTYREIHEHRHQTLSNESEPKKDA